MLESAGWTKSIFGSGSVIQMFTIMSFIGLLLLASGMLLVFEIPQQKDKNDTRMIVSATLLTFLAVFLVFVIGIAIFRAKQPQYVAEINSWGQGKDHAAAAQFA